jgi:GTP-binding protein
VNGPKRPPHPKDVEFIGAIANPGQPLPADLPQVAIAGKSNVGKSTLINRVTNRKKLARVSKRPGKTQEINFYRVDNRFLLSDLPGYGFAKAPPDVRQRWGPLVESYLGSSQGLLGIVLLIDARHGPTPDDWQMIEYLERLGLPTLFVLTKTDKLTKSKRKKQLDKVQEKLGASDEQVLATSALSGEGVRDLWWSILELVESAA